MRAERYVRRRHHVPRWARITEYLLLWFAVTGIVVLFAVQSRGCLYPL